MGGRGASDGLHSSHVKAVARFVGGNGLPTGTSTTPATDKPEAATAVCGAVASLILVDFQRIRAGLAPKLVGTRGLHGGLLGADLDRFCWVNFLVITSYVPLEAQLGSMD